MSQAVKIELRETLKEKTDTSQLVFYRLYVEL